jgi:hypothetical protein
MSEIEKMVKFLGCEPIKTVENPESLSLEELFQLFLSDIITERDKLLLTEFFIYKRERLKVEDEDRFQDLVIMDEIMGGKLLPSIISELRRLNKYMKFSDGTLTSEEFRNMLHDMVYDHRVRLDTKDLKILNVLRDNVFITIDNLAEKSNLSFTTTIRHKKRLERRCRLGMFPQLVYSKIWLSNLLVLVEGEAHIESPYLPSRHELLGGSHLYTFFSVVVPHRALKQVRQEFEQNFSGVWTWRMYGFQSFLSFDFYDPVERDWNMDWASWSIYLNSILRNGLDKAVPQEEEIRGSPTLSMPPEKVKGLTAKNIKLIDLFLKKYNNTMQDLGKGAGCDVRTVYKARKKFFSSGILQPCPNMEHIGLDEHLLLIVESDLDNLYSLTFALRRLPKVWIYWARSLKGTNSLACLLETPLESFREFSAGIFAT